MNPLEHICGFDQTVPAAASEASFSQFAVNAASAAAASARAAPLLPKYTSRKITAASRSLQQVVPMPVPSHDGDKRSGAAAILHCLATAMNATIITTPASTSELLPSASRLDQSREPRHQPSGIRPECEGQQNELE
eukprot:CAMPEP_0172663438 /NCGR_PEP_ID=MMETSP1074-20121228/5930_1 /TAXON_ID=2916 /ORGANISM="Ceratium fusus, Strain PA161109" /LENGTH=135 /DNA_ID=CAMNT_0013479439 /DNA_START=93 /DNA_END=498 /DNA_ORIENTATION=-